MKDVEEREDVPPRAILGLTLGFVLLVAVGVLLVVLLLKLARREPSASAVPSRAMQQREEVNHLELSLFATAPRESKSRARAIERLGSYGYVDRQRGIVHIPIDRAIDLYVDRHAAPRGSTNPPSVAPSRQP